MRQHDSIHVLEFGVAALVALLAMGARTLAQVPAVEQALSVEPGDSCLSEARLRARVQHFRAQAQDAVGVHVHVERRDGAVGFVVTQKDRVLARREFPQLSAACDERRDTLALAIAVAFANASAARSDAPAASEGAVVPAESDADGGESSSARPGGEKGTTAGERRAVPGPAADSSRAAAGERRAVQEPAADSTSGAAAPLATREQRAASGVAADSSGGAAAPLAGNERRTASGLAAGSGGSAAAANAAVASEPAAGSSGPAAAVLAASEQGVGPTAMEDGEPASADVSATPNDRALTPRAPPSAAPGPRAWDVGLLAGARFGLELLPDPVLVFDAGVELGLARALSLQAAGFASPVSESAADGGRMRTQISGGELLLCARPVLANLLLRTCGGVGAASVGVRGDDFLVDGRARLAWLGGLLRAALRWPADALVAAELSLGGHANLVRPRIRVLGSEEPDRMSWLLGGSLGIQLVVALP